MKLFEYMGKELFAQYGVTVPKGRVVTSPEEAAKVAQEIGSTVVVKSQVLSGKRGKGGGIKFADNAEEARAAAEEILGMTVQGYKVETLLVEEKLQIDKELYLSITVDTSAKMPVIIASAEGGMEIEDVAEENIMKKHIDPLVGFSPYLGRETARRLGLTGPLAKEANKLMAGLVKMFKEKDAELVEINPLVISGDRLIAADSKVTIDDDALFRQKEAPVVEERTETEKKAHELGLAFVELGGDIAIMANGAGMAMGTLDTISYYGGSPANFLDAGGGTGMEETAQALELLLANKPKAVFINIFGGITRCDDVANAFLKVKQSREIPVPVVIRMVGTNEEEAIKLLSENGIEAYKVMHEAAQKVVELAKA
ncbi:MAG: ADP-forming succinate--CoA ligase subunit beta [Firmicutes bacterium]|nr:ADP-forming succinate--CoA ligase subunit beta [Bacillota bacterium]